MKRLVVVLLAALFIPFSSASTHVNPDYTGEILNLITEELLNGYIQTLQDFGPRVTGQRACFDAGTYLYNEFQSYGYEVRFINWSSGNYADRNVEAVLPGATNESVIICAHFDSVPTSPGADDNGSGTAAVLAAARALSEYKDEISLEYTIRFVTFSGEEEGLLGSYQYVSAAKESDMNIVAVLNADMIGYTHTEEGRENVVVYRRDNSDWIANMAATVSAEYSLGLTVQEYSAGASSDHWPFLQYGYDAVFFHEYEFNEYYHSEGDTIDHMDLEYDMRVTRLVVGTLIKIAEVEITDTEPPEVSIEKPGNYLYIADREIAPMKNTVIIGKITLQVQAHDTLSGIARVELYVDDEQKAELTREPYEWVWDEPSFFMHTVTAVARDNTGNIAEDAITAMIFNL